MPATYTASLPTDRDFVRFLVGDVVVASAMLQDEEIDAVLDAEGWPSPAVRYFAAARCLSTLHTRWMSAGRGKSSKKVSRLQIVYGTGAGINIDAAIQERIKELRREGARLLSPQPYALRCLAH